MGNYEFYYYFCIAKKWIMDFNSVILAPISEEREQFLKVFNSSLQSSNPFLKQVLEHVLQTSGKMMRPMLVLLTAKLFGKVTEEAMHAAVALEMLHNASLVHDDVVDESNERRGKPSVNAAFSNKVAVLSGDFMLATGLLEVHKTKNLRIMEIVFSIGHDLADGELLQLHNNATEEHSIEVYFDVIRKKTAVLFEACASIGAISAGASDAEVEMMRKYGEYIGLCFQIKDDIFDYTADSKLLGKPTGNDMQEGKLTLPALYALNKSKDPKAHALAAKVKGGTATSDEINCLIQFAIEEGGIQYAKQVMDSYRLKAQELIKEVPTSDVKTSLLAFLDYVIDREK